MKKLIQKRATGEFLMPDGTWSKDLEHASEIGHEMDVRTLRQQFIVGQELNLYYRFGTGRRSTEWDFAVPIEMPSGGSFHHHATQRSLRDKR